MRSQPIISVCIPTYNRAHIVQECVANILSFSSQDFEIIVSDNASTDETPLLLKKYMEDQRFWYYRNDVNVGYRNIYDAMKHAHGKYCFLLSDEDDIITDNFGKLNDILKSQKEYGVILADFELKKKRGNVVFKKDIDAFEKLANIVPQYMSGIVILKKALDEIENQIDAEEYCFNYFPHQYVSMLILLKYDGMILQERTCIHNVRLAQHNMIIEETLAPSLQKMITKRHWCPSQRWKELQGFLKLIDKCDISEKQKTYTAIYIWRRFSHNIVVGFSMEGGEEELYDERLPWGNKEYSDAKSYNPIGIVSKISKCVQNEIENQLLHRKIHYMLLKHPSCLMNYMKGVRNFHKNVKLLKNQEYSEF